MLSYYLRICLWRLKRTNKSRIASLRVEIRTQDVWNTKQQCYPLSWDLSWHVDILNYVELQCTTQGWPQMEWCSRKSISLILMAVIKAMADGYTQLANDNSYKLFIPLVTAINKIKPSVYIVICDSIKQPLNIYLSQHLVYLLCYCITISAKVTLI